MARINKMSPKQMKVAHEMRGLRLMIGMTKPNFGKVIKMDSGNVAARENLRVSWQEFQLKQSLAALINHLKASLTQVESLTSAFTVEKQTEPIHPKP